MSGSIQSLVCVLLVAATAVGSLPALGRACQCPAPATQTVPQKRAEAAPACCGTCCTTHVCCESETAVPAEPQGCSCVTCECDSPAPAKPDTVPPPAPIDTNSLELAAAPPAPAILIALPADAELRVGKALSPAPPTDLVTLLSRLTC